MQKNICIIAGDGIGPEVMNEAVKVLKTVGHKFGHTFDCTEALAGGAAFDAYGEHLPQSTIDVAKKSDAILFGSVGGPIDKQMEPKWNGAEKNTILGLRKTFGHNINLRPAKVFKDLKNICPLKDRIIEGGVDILTVRELSSGIYFGQPRETVAHESGKKAIDTMVYTTEEIEKVAHVAFQAARLRHKKVTSVDKANVLDCSKLWREVVTDVAKQYSDVELEHALVDSCAMHIITKPSHFDVIVTSNLFGDILSDASSVLPGSLGLMPSASFGDIHLYEPSGGSAPDIAGQGIANPIAQIMSMAMMLKYSFEMNEEFEAVEKAVDQLLADGYRTGDIFEAGMKKIGTEETGNLICEYITNS